MRPARPRGARHDAPAAGPGSARARPARGEAVERELRRVVDERRGHVRDRRGLQHRRGGAGRSRDAAAGHRRPDRDRELGPRDRARPFQVSPAGAGTWADACDDTTRRTRAPGTRPATTGSSTCAPSPATPRATSARRASPRRVDNTAPALASPTRRPSTAGGTHRRRDRRRRRPRDSVIVEYKPSAGSTWTEICHRSGTGTCAWDTSGSPTATTTCAPAPPTRSATPRPRPSSPPAGSTTPPAPASPPSRRPSRAARSRCDRRHRHGGSGVQKVVFEARPAGTPRGWTSATTRPRRTRARHTAGFTSPARLRAPDGHYEVRGVAYDGAGNAMPTPTVTLKIDNTKPTVALTPPLLAGTVTLTTTVTETGSGIDSVRFERRRTMARGRSSARRRRATGRSPRPTLVGPARRHPRQRRQRADDARR